MAGRRLSGLSGCESFLKLLGESVKVGDGEENVGLTEFRCLQASGEGGDFEGAGFGPLVCHLSALRCRLETFAIFVEIAHGEAVDNVLGAR